MVFVYLDDTYTLFQGELCWLCWEKTSDKLFLNSEIQQVWTYIHGAQNQIQWKWGHSKGLVFLHFSENLGSRFHWRNLEGTREKWCLRISRDTFLGKKTGLEANTVIIFRLIPLSAVAPRLHPSPVLPPSVPPGGARQWLGFILSLVLETQAGEQVRRVSVDVRNLSSDSETQFLVFWVCGIVFWHC